MVTKVYKVVRRDGYGSLCSLYAEGKYLTIYPPGVVVKFVYVDKRDANRYNKIIGDEVWECETEDAPRVCPDFVPDYVYTVEGGYKGISEGVVDMRIDEFWRHGWTNELYLIPVSEGSYLVDSVKLIRRVY